MPTRLRSRWRVLTRPLILALALALTLMSCRIVQEVVSDGPPVPPPATSFPLPPPITAAPETAADPTFSPLQFCTDVSDDGVPSGCAIQFPARTPLVYAYWTYSGLQDGLAWGRVWEQDGVTYIDASDSTWEDGEAGWIAYSIGDEDLLAGHYQLSLFLAGTLVQRGAFDVAASQAAPVAYDLGPAFGEITFSAGVSQDWLPIDPAAVFPPDTPEVYATFVYLNLTPEQVWSREWLLDGEVQARRDLVWDEDPPGSGRTYASFSAEEGQVLDPGVYTLNLYLGDQIARSAQFTVAAAAPPPAPPTREQPLTLEELVDPDLLPAYELLANSNHPLLTRLADMVMWAGIPIQFDDSLESNVSAAYRYDGSQCAITERGQRQPGRVVVSRQTWQEESWEELASDLAHELTHAYQFLEATYACETCSVEKEYEAWMVTIYALEEFGRWDIVNDRYSALVDSSGVIKRDTLWQVLKESYAECPEY
jgi:hypothetical protein